MLNHKNEKTKVQVGCEQSNNSLYRALTSKKSRKAADALFTSSEDELSINFERDGQQFIASDNSK